jgi:hypothetical protein
LAGHSNQFNSFSGNSLVGNTPGDGFFLGQDSVTITFAAPVNAFGIFFNADANTGGYGFETSVGATSTGSTTFDSTGFVFAGLLSTDTTFSSVTFLSLGQEGSYAVPELIVATAASVPEPSSLILASLGLCCCAALGWRRHVFAKRGLARVA